MSHPKSHASDTAAARGAAPASTPIYPLKPLPTADQLARMDPEAYMAALEDCLAGPRTAFLQNRLIRHLHLGTFTRELYIQQLKETFHFVRHTPTYILMAAARVGLRLPALQKRFIRHAQEEVGHDRWALEDLQALGVDVSTIPQEAPLPHTTALVAYQMHTVAHGNPVGLLGLEYAMEGSTAESAGPLITRIQALLQLPDSALNFFRRHVQVDAHHARENSLALVELVHSGEDRLAVMHNARDSYILYASLYDGICDQLGMP